MLQEEIPDDYVLATNETHTVREFVELAFEHAGVPLRFEGEGERELGVDRTTGKVLVSVDPRYYRPTEVELLIGNPAKATAKLGWKPKTLFSDLVKVGERVAAGAPLCLIHANNEGGLAAAREMMARAIIVGDVAGTTPKLIDELIG
jgi:hypothetical protein